MIHFLSNPPTQIQKTTLFYKEPFSSDKKSSLESTSLLKIQRLSEEGLSLSWFFLCFYWYLRGFKAFLLIPPKSSEES